VNNNVQRGRNFGYALKAIMNNVDFRIQLRFITELLKVTTSAATKIWARRFNPHGRRPYDFLDRGKAEFPLNPINSYSQNVARSC
jgi:hypothetical protein